VDEDGVTSLGRKDKSEPTLVVPFCDSSLVTHFLFSSGLTPGITRRPERLLMIRAGVPAVGSVPLFGGA
jgi:hypothetical protein